MNHKEIVVGRTYSDGKLGLRKVVSKQGSPIEVRYIILAAKVEREHVDKGEYVSVIGQESGCSLESFARWAKVGYDEEGGQEALRKLHARKIKLSSGEDAYMRSVIAEAGIVGPGTTVTYDHTEGRAVGGLEKKGLLQRAASGGEVELSLLGRAKLELLAA